VSDLLANRTTIAAKPNPIAEFLQVKSLSGPKEGLRNRDIKAGLDGAGRVKVLVLKSEIVPFISRSNCRSGREITCPSLKKNWIASLRVFVRSTTLSAGV
jgi:hypothetical protein